MGDIFGSGRRICLSRDLPTPLFHEISFTTDRRVNVMGAQTVEKGTFWGFLEKNTLTLLVGIAQ